MTQINNERFGEFILELRREKGLTQKELAEKLFISDKAVSKWERGISMPDIGLLIPLSQIFGLTVTEILSGQRIEKDKNLTVGEVEELMSQTIFLSKEKIEENSKSKKKRKIIFFSALIIVILELFIINTLGYVKTDFFISILTVELLMLIFGVYFTFFAKEVLPAYYDENKISFYSDGFLKMNLAGLHFNNSNWKHILCIIHLSVIGNFTLFPLLVLGLYWFNPTLGVKAQLIFSFIPLLILFVPVYIVGKKYE